MFRISNVFFQDTKVCLTSQEYHGKKRNNSGFDLCLAGNRQEKIRTTNAIEPTFREVRRRTRPMSIALPPHARERLFTGIAKNLNANWKESLWEVHKTLDATEYFFFPASHACSNSDAGQR
jgi:transposase-like protein